jgi:hypothetical protein
MCYFHLISVCLQEFSQVHNEQVLDAKVCFIKVLVLFLFISNNFSMFIIIIIIIIIICTIIFIIILFYHFHLISVCLQEFY